MTSTQHIQDLFAALNRINPAVQIHGLSWYPGCDMPATAYSAESDFKGADFDAVAAKLAAVDTAEEKRRQLATALKLVAQLDAELQNIELGTLASRVEDAEPDSLDCDPEPTTATP